MTLYEIDKAIEDAFYSAVDPDTGEIINDEALEALNELEEARNVKIENIALFIKNLDAEASAIKAEEERLRSRRTTTENRVKWLKDYLNNMLTDYGNRLSDYDLGRVYYYLGEYAQGVLQIRGFLKNHSDMYNKDQYSLYIVRTGKVDKMDEPTMLMNIPTWYGETLAADFAESGLPAAEYFDGASIKSISETKTRYNTTTIEIEIYES